MLLPVKVPKQSFLKRDLDLELLEVGRGSNHFTECDTVLGIHEDEVELRKILPVSPEGNVPVLGVKNAVLAKVCPGAGMRRIGALAREGPDERGFLRDLKEHLIHDRLKPAPFGSPHGLDIGREQFFALDCVHVPRGVECNGCRGFKIFKIRVQPRDHDRLP